MDRLWRLALLASAIGWGACSTNDAEPKASPPAGDGVVIAAAAGGFVRSPDGMFEIYVPPGALAKDTRISIARMPDAEVPAVVAAAHPISPVYRVEPDGLTFSGGGAVGRFRFDSVPASLVVAGDPPKYLSVQAAARANGSDRIEHHAETHAQYEDNQLIVLAKLAHFSAQFVVAGPEFAMVVDPGRKAHLVGEPWDARWGALILSKKLSLCCYKRRVDGTLEKMALDLAPEALQVSYGHRIDSAAQAVAIPGWTQQEPPHRRWLPGIVNPEDYATHLELPALSGPEPIITVRPSLPMRWNCTRPGFGITEIYGRATFANEARPGVGEDSAVASRSLSVVSKVDCVSGPPDAGVEDTTDAAAPDVVDETPPDTSVTDSAVADTSDASETTTEEVCDGIDNDGDGAIDEGCPSSFGWVDYWGKSPDWGYISSPPISGGSNASLLCPFPQVIVGICGRYDGKNLTALGRKCQAMTLTTDKSVTPYTYGVAAPTLGACSTTSMAGASFGGTTFDWDCPSGMIVQRVIGTHGTTMSDRIGQLQVECVKYGFRREAGNVWKVTRESTGMSPVFGPGPGTAFDWTPPDHTSGTPAFIRGFSILYSNATGGGLYALTATGRSFTLATK